MNIFWKKAIIVKSLIDEKDYDTILHVASLKDHNFIVYMLLKKKVDVNAQNEEYNNALLATLEENYDQVMQMLLKKEVEINA